jgi:hypothetical protein
LIECANKSTKRSEFHSQVVIAFPAIQIVRNIRNGVLPIGGMSRLEGVVTIIAPQLVDANRPSD